MRELVFRVSYDAGADPVMDVYRTHGELRSRSMACHVSAEGVWRVDRLSGPTEALERIDEVYATHERCLDCVTGVHDRATTEHEVLAASRNARTVYTFREAGSGCFSLPCLTCKHVTRGILTESQRRGNTEEWRLLLRDDTGVGAFYDELEETIRPGLTVEFARLSEPEYWTERSVTVSDLPTAQRTAVEAAVAHGYYETPRELSLSELASVLDVPRSTLQYRLQQAEGWVVKQFVADSSLGDVPNALAEGGALTVGD